MHRYDCDRCKDAGRVRGGFLWWKRKPCPACHGMPEFMRPEPSRFGPPPAPPLAGETMEQYKKRTGYRSPEDCVLEYLAVSDRSGRDLRDLIATDGHPMSPVAFYDMMSKLERKGVVAGRYEALVVHGQSLKERWYTAP